MQIMIASTTLFLSAARFGLAPTSNAHTGAGTKLYVKNDSGVASNDPSGIELSADACLPMMRYPCLQMSRSLW